MRFPFLAFALVGGLSALSSIEQGCPGDDDTPTPLPGCPAGTYELEGACVPELPEGWTQNIPGAPTICGRGGEFSYFVKPGKVNKLVIGLDGGGACWDALTCSMANPTFSDSVTEDDNPNNQTEGVFAVNDPENPVADWFAVLIPYCTGDIHWGDTTTHYPASNGAPPVTIQHRGFTNATKVLDWVYDNFSAPDEILVTGVSAGSYGTLMYLAYLQEQYPNTRIVQLGDSGAGVITQEWLETSFSSWDAQKNFPDWIPEVHDADISTLSLNDIYTVLGDYYPEMTLSQFNTASDDVQEFYLEAMGGDPSLWYEGLEANINACIDGNENFRAYTSWGAFHGILPYEEMYSVSVNGVRFRDWFAGLVGDGNIENVHCTDCETPEYYQP